jgi:hypothetical protein
MFPNSLGGRKVLQLESRRRYSRESFGCAFDSLGVQPAEYIPRKTAEECNRLLTDAATRNRAWLLKPRRSSGKHPDGDHRYYPDSQSLLAGNAGEWPCLANKSKSEPNRRESLKNKGAADMTVQEYVKSALLRGGTRKFDVRTWLLVASAAPLVLFVAEGFGRVATSDYNTSSTDLSAHISNLRGAVKQMKPEEHFISFSNVSVALTKEYGLPANHMESTFMRRAVAVSRFAALAAQWVADKAIALRPRAAVPMPVVGTQSISIQQSHFQFFACDWVVDVAGQGHLLECNSTPVMRQQHLGGSKAGRRVETAFWSDALGLVEALHISKLSSATQEGASAGNGSRRSENWNRRRGEVLSPGFKSATGWRLALYAGDSTSEAAAEHEREGSSDKCNVLRQQLCSKGSV